MVYTINSNDVNTETARSNEIGYIQIWNTRRLLKFVFLNPETINCQNMHVSAAHVIYSAFAMTVSVNI